VRPERALCLVAQRHLTAIPPGKTVTLTYSVTVDPSPTGAIVSSTSWGGDTCPGPSPGLAQGCTPNVTTNPTSVQPPIQQVTTVHTGEPWAGSRPLVLVGGATGAILIGLGSLRRRQVRREPVRVDH
jgi:hypothetical protein